MRYLVDTDWVVAYLKGNKEVVELLNQHANEGLAISLITYGEIYEGIYYGRDAKAHERGFLAFLRGVNVVPLNRTIMKRFARIRGELRAKGQIIGDPDILIAATALQHDLTLLTFNLRHFSRISDLKTYQPG
jgi:predicted nucleic acid-binding protein